MLIGADISVYARLGTFLALCTVDKVNVYTAQCASAYSMRIYKKNKQIVAKKNLFCRNIFFDNEPLAQINFYHSPPKCFTINFRRTL